ncbi:MAG TPA: hypothetical protein VFW04_17880 [Gemmatimonadaceae bacterium]|nr:hypothetical protein [Gemmatimonadaceae bacterium]
MRTSRPSRWFMIAALGAAPLGAACFGGDAGAPVWTGPSFSADLVDPSQPTDSTTHIYLSDGKLRIESTDTSQLGALVLDPAHKSTLLINDRKQEYFDAGMFTSLVTATFGPVLRFFRPAGAGDPCTEWNTTAMPFAAVSHDKSHTPPHFTCKSLGSDKVDGRPAHKWQWIDDAKDGGTGTVWIDDRLQVVSKADDRDDHMELRNIKEGSVPASMFAPPPSYKKVSVTSIMGSLMSGSKDKESHP